MDDPKLAVSGKHRCDNCGKVWTAAKLKDFCDIMQRLTPGGVVPSGECPDCKAFCYPVEKKAAPKGELAKAIKKLRKVLGNDDYGNDEVRDAALDVVNTSEEV